MLVKASERRRRRRKWVFWRFPGDNACKDLPVTEECSYRRWRSKPTSNQLSSLFRWLYVLFVYIFIFVLCDCFFIVWQDCCGSTKVNGVRFNRILMAISLTVRLTVTSSRSWNGPKESGSRIVHVRRCRRDGAEKRIGTEGEWGCPSIRKPVRPRVKYSRVMVRQLSSVLVWSMIVFYRCIIGS